jgi:hypothetical protein
MKGTAHSRGGLKSLSCDARNETMQIWNYWNTAAKSSRGYKKKWRVGTSHGNRIPERKKNEFSRGFTSYTAFLFKKIIMKKKEKLLFFLFCFLPSYCLLFPHKLCRKKKE